MTKILKIIVIVELATIILLGILLYLSYHQNNNSSVDKYPLLSQRVSSGILEPESYLILNFKPLEQEMTQWINDNNIDVSVYVLNIRDGASFGINEDKSYRAVSFNKLPLAMIILKKVEEGNLTLETQLPITQEDVDSRDGTLYSKVGTTLSVKELLNHMLSESDNTAFNVLRKKVTLLDLQRLSAYLDYYDHNINYTSIENVFQISPKSTSNLFMSLYLSTVLKPEDSQLILSDLTSNSFNIKKYAELPENVVVAHKYGEYALDNNPLFHDCGIMYIQDSRIFYCVMTSGLKGETAYNVVGSAVNGVYNYVLTGREMKQTGINL